MLEVTWVGEAASTRFGVLGNVFVQVFDGVPDARALKVFEEQVEQLLQREPRFISFTVIAAPKLKAPDAEFRAASARLAARFEQQTHCAAVVIATKGLAALVARTFLAAYQRLVKAKTPTLTFGDVDEAMAWVNRRVPESRQLSGAAAAIAAFAFRR